MKVYFLRHGLAGDPNEWEGDDFDRPLTDEGRERMTREAKAMAKLDLEPDVIVTSPLVRAKQTAEIVADRLRLRERLVEDERLAPGFNTERLVRILQDHTDADALMVVGHEPDFSFTLGQLIGGGKIDLKKGGLACVDLPDAASLDAVLLWLVPPKVLTL